MGGVNLRKGQTATLPVPPAPCHERAHAAGDSNLKAGSSFVAGTQKFAFVKSPLEVVLAAPDTTALDRFAPLPSLP